MPKSIFALLREERAKAVNESVEETPGTPSKSEVNENNVCVCPACGSDNVEVVNVDESICRCGDCGHTWVKVVEDTPAEEPPAEAEVVEDTPAEEPPAEPEINEGDVISGTFCPVHGLVSGVGDSQVTNCPICGETGLIVKSLRVLDEGEVVESTGTRVSLSESQREALRRARALSTKRETVNEEDGITCPECGFSGNLEDFEEEDGVYFCPDCGAIVEVPNEEDTPAEDAPAEGTPNEEPVEEGVTTSKMKLMLESVGAPEAMFTALKNGKTKIVQRYINNAVGGK